MCVCVCVCVCGGSVDGVKGGRWGGVWCVCVVVCRRELESVGERESVCVYMCVCVCGGGAHAWNLWYGNGQPRV